MKNQSSDVCVSIIVPIYGVEKYIERCAVSLFEQTYPNIEYIFINDCTKDSSLQILLNVIDNYPARKKKIKIINKQKNEGLPQARKTGIENASGDYLCLLDSDDWADRNMISDMVSEAILTNADIVYTDWFQNELSIEKYCICNKYLTPHAYIKDAFYLKVPATTWNKLYKSSIFKEHSIEFPSENMHEDLAINIQLFYYAHSISYINKAYYHYRINPSSLTRNYNIKSSYMNLYMIRNLIYKMDFFEIEQPFCGFINYIITFYCKKPNIWHPTYLKKLIRLYPISMDYIFAYNPILKSKDRILLFLLKMRFKLL